MSRNLKNLRDKCEQQQNSVYAATISKALWYKEVCEILGLPLDFILYNKCKHNKQTNE